MKATEQEMADYLAGKLKLVTTRSTGKVRFVPATPRSTDKGKTSAERRAYYRIWYLKNRDARRAYERQRHIDSRKGLPKKVKAVRPASVEARLAKKRAYAAQWRKDNADKLPGLRRQWRAARQKAAVTVIPQEGTKAERAAAYQKRWREKNRERIAANARDKYRAMKARVAASRTLTKPVVTMRELEPGKKVDIAKALGATVVAPVKKKGWLQRLLGAW